ncbi:hypothetical protein J6TS2_08540 [Heyndrickxia sporothermodurans]|nr:hypothetical protein J6TS2_08540 [Heyndrickxia sporothermodurans]
MIYLEEEFSHLLKKPYNRNEDTYENRRIESITRTALYQNNVTLQETMLSLPDSEIKMEWKFEKNLFNLTTDEKADKWYGGKDDTIGFNFEK